MSERMERVTYEQVQRAMDTMPDLVDVIRWLRPQLEAMAAEGRTVVHDQLRFDQVGVRWDRGN